ncbi:MAG: hypothetical protein CK424_07045 [Legionella sp.]|nr:MAG: hypothetical protein CK424_07045 [Legionella sp.]
MYNQNEINLAWKKRAQEFLGKAFKRTASTSLNRPTIESLDFTMYDWQVSDKNIGVVEDRTLIADVIGRSEHESLNKLSNKYELNFLVPLLERLGGSYVSEETTRYTERQFICSFLMCKTVKCYLKDFPSYGEAVKVPTDSALIQSVTLYTGYRVHLNIETNEQVPMQNITQWNATVKLIYSEYGIEAGWDKIHEQLQRFGDIKIRFTCEGFGGYMPPSNASFEVDVSDSNAFQTIKQATTDLHHHFKMNFWQSENFEYFIEPTQDLKEYLALEDYVTGQSNILVRTLPKRPYTLVEKLEARYQEKQPILSGRPQHGYHVECCKELPDENTLVENILYIYLSSANELESAKKISRGLIKTQLSDTQLNRDELNTIRRKIIHSEVLTHAERYSILHSVIRDKDEWAFFQETGMRLERLLEHMNQIVIPTMSQLEACSKPRIMVMGPTGIGKSALVGSLLGEQLKTVSINYKNKIVYANSSTQKRPKIGQGESQTKGCAVYSRTERPYAYIDCAGIFDTEGYEAEVCNAMAVKFAAAQTCPRAVILLLEEHDITVGKAHIFRQRLTQLKRVFPNIDKAWPALLFVVNNHGQNEPGHIVKSRIIEQVKQLIDEDIKKRNKLRVKKGIEVELWIKLLWAVKQGVLLKELIFPDQDRSSDFQKVAHVIAQPVFSLFSAISGSNQYSSQDESTLTLQDLNTLRTLLTPPDCTRLDEINNELNILNLLKTHAENVIVPDLLNTHLTQESIERCIENTPSDVLINNFYPDRLYNHKEGRKEPQEVLKEIMADIMSYYNQLVEIKTDAQNDKDHYLQNLQDYYQAESHEKGDLVLIQAGELEIQRHVRTLSRLRNEISRMENHPTYRTVMMVPESATSPIYVDENTIMMQYKDGFLTAYWHKSNVFTPSCERKSLPINQVQAIYDTLMGAEGSSDDTHLIQSIISAYQCPIKTFTKTLRNEGIMPRSFWHGDTAFHTAIGLAPIRYPFEYHDAEAPYVAANPYTPTSNIQNGISAFFDWPDRHGEFFEINEAPTNGYYRATYRPSHCDRTEDTEACVHLTISEQYAESTKVKVAYLRTEFQRIQEIKDGVKQRGISALKAILVELDNKLTETGTMLVGNDEQWLKMAIYVRSFFEGNGFLVTVDRDTYRKFLESYQASLQVTEIIASSCDQVNTDDDFDFFFTRGASDDRIFSAPLKGHMNTLFGYGYRFTCRKGGKREQNLIIESNQSSVSDEGRDILQSIVSELQAAIDQKNRSRDSVDEDDGIITLSASMPKKVSISRTSMWVDKLEEELTSISEESDRPGFCVVS